MFAVAIRSDWSKLGISSNCSLKCMQLYAHSRCYSFTLRTESKQNQTRQEIPVVPMSVHFRLHTFRFVFMQPRLFFLCWCYRIFIGICIFPRISRVGPHVEMILTESNKTEVSERKSIKRNRACCGFFFFFLLFFVCSDLLLLDHGIHTNNPCRAEFVTSQTFKICQCLRENIMY